MTVWRRLGGWRVTIKARSTTQLEDTNPAATSTSSTFNIHPSRLSQLTVTMKTTLIFTTLFAALVAATPVDLDTRQVCLSLPLSFPCPTTINTPQTATIRVQLSDDATDTAVQANIPKNGAKISISKNFGNLGSGVPANRALVVSGSGSCDIFKDAGATQKVATIRSGANDANFTRVNLQNGVIVCK